MQPLQLGPFKIRRTIGRGGMGAVYEAVHAESGEVAAVKALLGVLEEDVEMRLRFESEIETLKRLRHPNIVRLYGFGEEAGMLYYVMEYVDGPSLHAELRRRRHFEWYEVAKIGLDLCLALKHGHDRGITHRDIKPANILLEREGTTKLSDYGIARFFGGERITNGNAVVGTLEYMAPEQALAQPVGPRADMYSLGAVLYALLAGRPPYSAKSLAELLRRHGAAPVEPVRAGRLDIPEAFDAIVRDLLKLRPEDRPGNAYLAGRRIQSLLQATVGPPESIVIAVEEARPPEPVTRPVATSFAGGLEPPASRDMIDENGLIDLGGIARPPSTDAAEEAESAVSAGALPLDFGPPPPISGTYSPTPRHAGFGDSPAKKTKIKHGDVAVGPPTCRPFGNEPVSETKTSLLSAREREEPQDVSDAGSGGISKDARVAPDGTVAEAVVSLSGVSRSAGEETQADPLLFVAGNDAMPVKAAPHRSAGFPIRPAPSVSPPRDETPASVEKPAPSRFVMVGERELDDFNVEPGGRRRWVSLQTWIIASALLLIGIATFYLLQPASPEVLYARIRRILDDPDSPDRITALRRADPSIQLFTKWYSDHPYAPAVRANEEELSLANEERALERGNFSKDQIKAFPPAKRAYMEAITLSRTNPEEAVVKLRAIVDLYQSDKKLLLRDTSEPGPPAPPVSETHKPGANKRGTGGNAEPHDRGDRPGGSTENYVLLAQRRLESMERELARVDVEQVHLLRRRLDDAKELQSIAPERSQAIRRAMIDLYGDRAWAAEVVDEARKALEAFNTGESPKGTGESPRPASPN